MLEKVKKSLRLSSDTLDDDIQHNIDACLLDLNMAGIIVDGDNELIIKAVELYCKWTYNYLDIGDKWLKAYHSMKDAMSLSMLYSGEV